MESVVTIGNKLFISYSFLRRHGIAKATIFSWQQRGISTIYKENNNSYVLYDSIPVATRAKLPTKDDIVSDAWLEQRDNKIHDIYTHLKHAYDVDFRQYVDYYRNKYQIVDKKAKAFAKDHAVWNWIVNDYEERNLEALYKAFDKIYPKRYSCKHSFSNAMRKAKEGVENVAFDKRIINAPLNVKQVTADNKYWVAMLTSIGKKYGPIDIHKKVVEMCVNDAKKPPSLSWVKKYHKEIKRNPLIFKMRNGASAYRGKKSIYTSMKHALHANSQWQIDGWSLPFWADGIFNRYVLVVVMDAHSKKIVGCSVGKSENTITILTAIQDAVINTNYLPGELVMDNHSFNKTKEAAYLKEKTENKGVQWTITENPQYKAIIERYFQYLDAECKNIDGYIGQGIKSKKVNAHPSPETIEKYSKCQYTSDEIKSICAIVVEYFNNAILKKEGKSPNELYDISDKKNGFEIDLYDRARILTPCTESKVHRGQINIERAGVTYEYQLNAAMNIAYDEKTVLVHYEDLNDCIYLYDKKTEKAIGSVKLKPKIHGAKVDQTPKDIELLNKHKGRDKGIAAISKKEIIELQKKGLIDNPNAIDSLNIAAMPKDIVQEVTQQKHIKQRAENFGADTNKLPQRTLKSEIELQEEEEEMKRSRNSPFYTKGSMNRINPDQYANEE